MRRHDRDRGTCFLLYPQAPVLAAYRRPERVVLSSPPGSLGPGPCDERIYVADAIGKAAPYGYPYLPPWTGPVHRPPRPDPDGHYDHLDPASREFLSAHLFGAVLHTLDIWEGYLGRRIGWHFRPHYRRLELIPEIDWDNAHSGYGFVETGWNSEQQGGRLQFALSLDTIAHEIGHSILFSEVGIPVGRRRTAEFLAFHEAMADLMALIGSMRFEAVLDHVLRTTHGNLYVTNEINRIAELSQTEQIRVASHDVRMADVEDIWLDADGEWHDAQGRGRHAHDLGQPLLGAVFDILIEIYEVVLVEHGLITPELDRLSRSGEYDPDRIAAVERGFAEAFVGRAQGFREALVHARDYLGFALARVIEDLAPEGLTFGRVAAALLAADREMSDGDYAALIHESFAWRGIRLRS